MGNIMTCKINADTSDGLKIVSDTSGAVDIQSNGTTVMSVDSNGVQNEPVVQDIAFTDASGTMTPNVVRGLKRFIVQSGPPPTWVWDVDL